MTRKDPPKLSDLSPGLYVLGDGRVVDIKEWGEAVPVKATQTKSVINVCIQCGESFLARRGASFCSNTCRVAHSRKA